MHLKSFLLLHQSGTGYRLLDYDVIAIAPINLTDAEELGLMFNGKKEE